MLIPDNGYGLTASEDKGIGAFVVLLENLHYHHRIFFVFNSMLWLSRVSLLLTLYHLG